MRRRTDIRSVFPANSRAWAVASGLAVASIGFLLTRSTTVASATAETSTTFLLGDLPFLVIGLSLAAFGVGIAISEWGQDHGTTVARWCLFGTAATAITVAVSLAGAGMSAMFADGATVALALDLILTGAVGGTITGVQASRRRESSQELEERNNRLTLLNRVLRHEGLNGLNIVRGYAELVGTDDGTQADGTGRPDERLETDGAKADGGSERTADAADAIRRSADRINDAVDELARLSRPSGTGPIELSEVLESCVADARRQYPHAEIELVDDTDAPAVVATRRVEHLFEHLIANAVEHNDAETPPVEVIVACDWNAVNVTVADDGDGLPERQRRILLDGTLPEYDDPASGFGLTIVRLLATESSADITVTEGIDDGVGVSLTFQRHRAPDGIATGSLDTGVPTGPLRVGAVAAVFAGIVMGIPLSTLQGSIPVIGALYGSPSPLVGWTVHIFHSLVFGLGFVALVSTSRLVRYRSRVLPTVAVGITYGAGLWLVAAGTVMPLWLRALGTPAPVPNLPAAGLLGHVLWGATLGGVFAFGRRWLNQSGGNSRPEA